jgi:hypothetical protein
MHGRWFDGRQIEVEVRGKFEGSLDIVQLGTLLLPLDAEPEHGSTSTTASTAASAASSSSTATSTASQPTTAAVAVPEVTAKDSTPDDDLMALLSSV